MVETGAISDLADGEIIVDVNTKVTNDMHWLDDVTASVISAQDSC